MSNNFVVLALLASFAAVAGAQGTINVTCGANGKPDVRAVSASGKAVTFPPGSGPLREMENMCIPPSPDFIGQDSKELLAKITLTKPQTDSSKKLTKSFTDKQRPLAEKRMKAINSERSRNRDTKAVADPELRQLYLTAEMRALRDELGTALRALMTAEQVPSFETNLAAVKARDR